MTDALASRATRESWIASGRRLFSLRLIVLTAACGLILLLALRRESHWLWLAICGLVLAIFALMALIWVIGIWWAPREARKKIAHLPHRRVAAEFNVDEIVLQTATERLSVTWSDLKEIRRLPNFWVICFKGGAQIPLPRDLLALAQLEVILRKAGLEMPAARG